MPISKPSKKQEAFIQGKKPKNPDKKQGVLLRIPQEFLDKIDADIAQRPFKISRHSWILEAIHKAL